MKILNIHMDPTLWKKMSRDKSKMELNWADYMGHLFHCKTVVGEALRDSETKRSQDFKDFLHQIGVERL